MLPSMLRILKDLLVGATVGVAGGLAFTEPLLFGLHSWADWAWWFCITAAYFAGVKLARQDYGAGRLLKAPT